MKTRSTLWAMALAATVLAALGAAAMAQADASAEDEEIEETAPPPKATKADQPKRGSGADAASEQPKAEPPEAKDPNMAPLKVELPKPQFRGTPKSIKFDEHREKPSNKPRPTFYVPKGAETNVARARPVTSSDKEPIIGQLRLATDGDKEGVEGSYVELGPGVQWLQVDLKEGFEIYAILLWHFHGEGRIYHDVVVQAADDPDFIENVRTLYNNDYDNSAGLGVGKDLEYLESYEGRLIPVQGAKARYLRFYSNGSTSNEMNHYTEVEVYAKSR